MLNVKVISLKSKDPTKKELGDQKISIHKLLINPKSPQNLSTNL